MSVVHSKGAPLDSRQLQTFAALVKTGSFTLAGRELFVSQSAVSHSLKGLESDMGCRLFDRSGKKVHLTPAGEHLLHFAEKILADMAAAREAMAHRDDWGAGRLHLGAGPEVCQYILPGVLHAFRKEFPDWLIRVEPAETDGCVQLVRDRQLDLAIAVAPHTDGPVETIPLFLDELRFMVSPEHPWADKGAAPRDDFVNQSFLFCRTKSRTFQLVDRYFRRDGVVLKPDLELGTIGAVKELAKLGAGVAVLPAWAARDELARRTLVSIPLGPRRLKRHWFLLRSREAKSGWPQEKFLQLCRSAADALVLAG